MQAFTGHGGWDELISDIHEDIVWDDCTLLNLCISRFC
jgi:hypothetical protein